MKALFAITVLLALGAMATAATIPVNQKTPETICKNTKLYKNFEVIVQVTPQEDHTFQASVRKQHVLGRKFGQVTSFELMKPETVAKTQEGIKREYKGNEFYLLVPLESLAPTKTHHGNLEMSIDGKKTKMEVTCVDQG